MTINITYDKVFALRSGLVIIAVVTALVAYRKGYNRGLEDMARYAQQAMQEQAEAHPRPGTDPFHELPGSSIN